MNTVLKTLVIFSLLFVAACSSVTKDIQITTEADSKAAFDGYKSYAWLETAEIVFDPDGQWEPSDMDLDSELRFIINDKLRDRGMLEANENPDMYVVFFVGVDMAAQGLKEDPDTKMQMLVDMPQAGLVVGFIDADTGYLIWVGVAEGDAVGDRDLDDTRKRLEYAVKKMFKQIP
jgi:hypothetical protein